MEMHIAAAAILQELRNPCIVATVRRVHPQEQPTTSDLSFNIGRMSAAEHSRQHEPQRSASCCAAHRNSNHWNKCGVTRAGHSGSYEASDKCRNACESGEPFDPRVRSGVARARSACLSASLPVDGKIDSLLTSPRTLMSSCRTPNCIKASTAAWSAASSSKVATASRSWYLIVLCRSSLLVILTTARAIRRPRW